VQQERLLAGRRDDESAATTVASDERPWKWCMWVKPSDGPADVRDPP
jgi:hypothetical protein